jgi:hypothetical protein
MAPSLFISYGHGDLKPFDWLERLKLYLAPLRRQDAVKLWDDTQIKAGSDWRREISTALERASAATFLVGPSFLASEFVANSELPALLGAAATRATRIYPLVVGYCAYRSSVLEPYQAFNDPEHPLEALPPPEQNRILNELSMAVDQDLRSAPRTDNAAPAQAGREREVLQEIARRLGDTDTAFHAQARRRNALFAAIRKRLGVTERLEYEKFFHRYYTTLNSDEQFEFAQIRAVTEGTLHDGNQRILTLIEQHPAVLDAVPELVDLRQHLVFWLNKYDKVFSRRPDMSVLYTGVEDRVPFPDEIGQKVAAWLASHPA